MTPENLSLIKYKYEMGGYTLELVMNLVEREIITEDEFKSVTTYHYQGLKANREKGAD